jgi:adenylosuccinate synthase
MEIMQALIVVDLGFGDAGKGSLVDYLVRKHHAHTVIRFNGGAQAAHNVVTPDGRHHTFAQFGSGSLVPGVRTHLSRFMLVDPVALFQEEQHLRSLGVMDAFDRMSIDRNALVVTPFQRAANRLRELARNNGRHGSCGMGIGETMADQLANSTLVLRVGELVDLGLTTKKLRFLQDLKRQEATAWSLPQSPLVDREMALLNDRNSPSEFANLFRDLTKQITIAPSSSETLHAEGTVVFEGAQGVLLDEWFGFHPYTTWSTTTFTNALTLLRENGYPGEITRIGATRAYMTRHGPGPFVTEDSELTTHIPEPHNGMNDWQRNFRRGWPDLVMLRYAIDVAGSVDQLALTCLDHWQVLPHWKICRRYHHKSSDVFREDQLKFSGRPDLELQSKVTAVLHECQPIYENISANELSDYVQASLGCPIGIRSFGPTHQFKRSEASIGRFSEKPIPSALPMEYSGIRAVS